MICLSIIKQIDSVSQKQPLEVFSEKRFSYKFHKIHRKTSVPILFFNKVAGLRPASLLKKRPWHRCFPLNFAKFLRTPFLQNTPAWNANLNQIYRNYRSLKQSPPYVSFEIFGLRMPHSSFFIFTERKRGFSFLF